MFGYNSSIHGGGWLPPHTWQAGTRKRRNVMGEKNSKKDKNKADKQKQAHNDKKKDEQKNKLPAKKAG
jgi:hypothetical protein